MSARPPGTRCAFAARACACVDARRAGGLSFSSLGLPGVQAAWWLRCPLPGGSVALCVHACRLRRSPPTWLTRKQRCAAPSCVMVPVPWGIACQV